MIDPARLKAMRRVARIARASRCVEIGEVWELRTNVGSWHRFRIEDVGSRYAVVKRINAGRGVNTRGVLLSRLVSMPWRYRRVATRLPSEREGR